MATPACDRRQARIDVQQEIVVGIDAEPAARLRRLHSGIPALHDLFIDVPLDHKVLHLLAPGGHIHARQLPGASRTHHIIAQRHHAVVQIGGVGLADVRPVGVDTTAPTPTRQLNQEHARPVRALVRDLVQGDIETRIALIQPERSRGVGPRRIVDQELLRR